MRITAAALAFVLVACASVAPDYPESVMADRLFCGRNIPGGGTVSDDEWNAFVREIVTPRFPEGLTVWRAEGQWQGKDGEIVREPVMIIEVLHPVGRKWDVLLEEIADEYRRRFHQDAVMRVSMPAWMKFVD